MIQGVDRSHLNDPASLASLKAKGIEFIYFKASQSVSYQDPTFDASWKEAIAVPGLKRGAYHFFDPRYDGVQQANNFLSMGIVFNNPGCLPPCVDVEDLVGKNDDDTASINKWIADNWQVCVLRLTDFLNTVKEKTGCDCVIYSYNNYMREYYHSHPFLNNDFWLSSLQENCPVRYDNGKQPLFWQYTYRWNQSDMDGDYFTGTEQQLNAIANIT